MRKLMVKIGEIDLYGVEEAELEFEVNGNKYRAFSYPCDFREGEIAEVDIDILCVSGESDESFLTANADKKRELIQAEERQTKWTYHAYGEVVGTRPVTVDCGDMVFELGYQAWGRFVNLGDYVYFFIDRLDIDRT